MTDTEPAVAALLHDLTPVASEQCTWPGGMRLEISAYLTTDVPPLDLISSVRSVLFRQGDVMLMTSRDGTQHILPGGRCEPGESLEQTLARELAGETGWTARQSIAMGFLRLSHLSQKPSGFRYPYPDSFQVVFCSEAESRLPTPHQIDDEWEQEARFVPVAEAEQAKLAPTDMAFLQAARSVR